MNDRFEFPEEIDLTEFVDEEPEPVPPPDAGKDPRERTDSDVSNVSNVSKGSTDGGKEKDKGKEKEREAKRQKLLKTDPKKSSTKDAKDAKDANEEDAESKDPPVTPTKSQEPKIPQDYRYSLFRSVYRMFTVVIHTRTRTWLAHQLYPSPHDTRTAVSPFLRSF